MFTGIIQEIGTIASLPSGGMVITAEKTLEGIELGGSIAVNGVCQTVTAFTDSTFSVDVMPETLQRTNLGTLRIGDRVNLERPLELGGEIGGHLVQGHIDDTGQVISVNKEGESIIIRFEAPEELMQYIVEKGLPPWNFAFNGNVGKAKSKHYPVNFPNNQIFPNSLSRYNVDPVGMIGTCLRAEHKHRVEDDFQKKKGKVKYKFNPGYTTILHFMYRLRIKSNYQNADIFLAEAPDNTVVDFNNNLSLFCYWTLLLFEIYIIKRTNSNKLYPIMLHYLSDNKKARQLRERYSFYKSKLAFN